MSGAGPTALALVVCAIAAPASAQEPDAYELAKKVADPISDLVAVPFQMNWDSGVGPDEQTRSLATRNARLSGERGTSGW